ncbi:hypothetical protein ZWY2020_007984 [Hordeum vulgare]|nr:hypothetical protein ZWY2020_007984 [Hordeum vulgare]
MDDLRFGSFKPASAPARVGGARGAADKEGLLRSRLPRFPGKNPRSKADLTISQPKQVLPAVSLGEYLAGARTAGNLALDGGCNSSTFSPDERTVDNLALEGGVHSSPLSPKTNVSVLVDGLELASKVDTDSAQVAATEQGKKMEKGRDEDNAEAREEERLANLKARNSEEFARFGSFRFADAKEISGGKAHRDKLKERRAP